ncbi:conserved protein of unknown function precursor containing a type A C-terminal secretion signal [Tenacibaculum sp. 190130A14a]|uniref:T9SS type A sorting domain-containing protein n=3 Tax=Tenacibaculum polynesiense TaxID=3137857 RepID=UPI0032B20EE2
MNRKLLLIVLTLFSTITFAQNISFTFVNARNTNDGTDDFYEADIYIASDTDFKLGSGQVYFTYNTAAFGSNIHTSGNFQYLQPSGSILGEVYGFPAYKDFIVNDNTTSRVSTSFQQGVSSGTITANNVTTTPKHLFSIKIKYTDINETPNVAFETGAVYLDQFFTACGPTTFGFPDCTNHPGVQLTGDSFDSTGAVVVAGVSWLGTVDSNWTVTGNWGGGALPTTTDNVVIPNVATTPVIGSSVQINDLTVASLSSFEINENGGVQVDGNLDNNGTFTMTSTAANSASLIVKGTATGQVSYERGGLVANKWSIVTAPVSGQSVKDFVENASNNIRVNTTVTPNRYAVGYYDDSRTAGNKWVYYTVDDLASNSITFEQGRSYAISRASNGAVTFTGTVATIDVNHTVTASQWNAVGNPYTAFLPINENSGTNFINDNLASFDPTYVGAYVWDNTQNKYVAKTLASGESSLAPGQGFFVKTTSGISALSFKQAQRKVQPAIGGAFSRTASVPSIELSIASKSIKVNTSISYRSNATKGLDAGYDVGNFDGASLDIYTRLLDGSSEKNFTYQSLPTETNETVIIPVGVKAAAGTSIIISTTGTSLPEGAEVYLEDRLLEKHIDLTKESYQVTLSQSENGIGRFYLHSKVEVIIPEVTSEDIKLYTANQTLFVEGIQGERFEVTLYNTLGSLVYQGEFTGSGKNSIVLPKVETGVYVVNVKSTIGVANKKVILKK